MSKKVKMTCGTCRGENVVADASNSKFQIFLKWDIETQSWLGDLTNSTIFICDDCEDETILEPVEI